MAIKTQPRKKDWDRSPKPLGTVTIRYSAGNNGKRPQRYIKVSMGGRKQDRWMAYSRWLWEQENGPVPPGKLVIHQDGDLFNDDLDNLILGTAGDVVYLAHANDPKMSERNYRKLRKATAAHNRERGVVNRSLNWLPTYWYAWFPRAGQVWNEPRRSAHLVLGECGVSADWRRAIPAGLGWPDRSKSEAMILAAMADDALGPARVWTAGELLEAVNRLADWYGWRPRTISVVRCALSHLVAAGLIDRVNRGRYATTGMEQIERTRRSPVLPILGETLMDHADFRGAEKVDRLQGICRRCGCTEDNACCDDRGPCWWVESDLCSHCEGN